MSGISWRQIKYNFTENDKKKKNKARELSQVKIFFSHIRNGKKLIQSYLFILIIDQMEKKVRLFYMNIMKIIKIISNILLIHNNSFITNNKISINI